LCAAFFAVCGCAPKATEPPPVKKLKIAVVESREFPDEILGFGTLSYQKKIDVAAPADAVLDRLYMREGDVVRAGSLVARLANEQIDLLFERAKNEAASARAALDLADAAYIEARYAAEARLLTLEKSSAELAEALKEHDESRRKFDTQTVLYGAGGVSEESMRAARFALDGEAARIAISQRELEIRQIGCREKDLAAAGFEVPREKEALDEAFINLATLRSKAELRAAKARLLAAEKELKSAELARAALVIKAPAAGTVAVRHAEEGERVKKEDKLLTIIDVESLYATIPVREAEALRIQKGMAATVVIDGTNGSFEGSVDLVSPYAESQSFTFAVRILLPAVVFTAGSFARPGMFARAAIAAGPPKRILLARNAAVVHKTAGAASVFVVDGKQIHERSVRLGAQFDEGWEVLEGLSEGEVIAARADTGLQDGEYVSVSN
jgi:RND family efflux transporter MFP subunit